MKKQNYPSVSWSIFSVVIIFGLVLAPLGVFGASTIGTNMSTTGTFTQTVDSATAVRFQNAGGDLNVLVVDTTNRRVGVGAAPGTVFEVQGTASASYFFTQNTIQVAGAAASVAYSRFGTGTTGYAAFLSASNDVLITGDLEVDGNIFFDGKASVSGNFQTSSRIIAGNASHSFSGSLNVTKTFVVGSATASASGGSGYVAEFIAPGTATVSVLFGGSTVLSKGTCLQMKNQLGEWVYARIIGTTWTVNQLECNR